MGIPENCDDTRAAKQLHGFVGRLLTEEVPNLPSDASRRKFWDLMLASVQAKLPTEVVPVATQTPPKKPRPAPDSYTEAMELINAIEMLAGEICEAGQGFAESVSEKAADIEESVEKFGSATDGQLTALENMKAGLENWFHD